MLAKLKEMYSYNEESGRFTRLTNSGGYEVGSIAGRRRFTKFLEAVDARINAEILYGVTK